MNQKITGFHLDDENDWVAELEYHHGQHARHNPPFLSRPWVTSLEGRKNKIGITLCCKKCQRNEPIDSW
jgi:hypothetical protein